MEPRHGAIVTAAELPKRADSWFAGHLHGRDTRLSKKRVIGLMRHAGDASVSCERLSTTRIVWLRNGRYVAALRWIDAGVNVAFDADSRATYRKLAADAALLEEEIERVLYETERRLNMDSWLGIRGDMLRGLWLMPAHLELTRFWTEEFDGDSSRWGRHELTWRCRGLWSQRAAIVGAIWFAISSSCCCSLPSGQR
jgi:hypothetical protein